MAFVEGDMKVAFYVQDGTAKEHRIPVTLNPGHPDCADMSTVVSAAGVINLAACANALDAVSMGKVTKFVVSQEYVNNAGGTGAGDSMDKAVISALLAGDAGKRATINIPMPAAGIFVGDGAFGPDSETVDGGDPSLLTYLGLFSETVTNDDAAPSGVFLISDGEQLKNPPAPRGRKV